MNAIELQMRKIPWSFREVVFACSSLFNNRRRFLQIERRITVGMIRLDDARKKKNLKMTYAGTTRS